MGQKKELLRADVRARQRVKEFLLCLKDLRFSGLMCARF
jgi:hypothetical protein